MLAAPRRWWVNRLSVFEMYKPGYIGDFTAIVQNSYEFSMLLKPITKPGIIA